MAQGQTKYLLRGFFLTLIISALFTSIAKSQDNTRLSIINDAAGQFNERGYMKANSYSLDGSEMINDFNGNLMYVQRLKYLPVSQNGVHFDLKVAYNGSVGHVIYPDFVGPATPACGGHVHVTNMNMPEWIISINDIAIQTFNFENELTCLLATPDSIHAHDSGLSALIPGYHDCYSFVPNGSYVESHNVVKILMGDGSVRQYMRRANGIEPKVHAPEQEWVNKGEYRSLSKDDQSRGYVDSTGEFTLFNEDGTRVRFRYYTPTWRTRFVDPLKISKNDSLRIFLPVEFLDQMGHSISIAYGESECWDSTYGRPTVISAGEVVFNWFDSELQIVDGCRPRYHIRFSGSQGENVSRCGEVNRGYVTEIEDAERRTTSFDYTRYFREALSITDGDVWCGNEVWSDEGPHVTPLGQHYDWFYTAAEYRLAPRRLHRIRWPEGGKTYYSYYNDAATEWIGDTVAANDILDSISHEYRNFGAGPCFMYGNPCEKTESFDALGRDAFFTNMVTAKRRVGNDGAVITNDSLVFSWTVLQASDSNIDLTDTFFTVRLTDSSLIDSEGDPTGDYKKKTEILYRQFPEKGDYNTNTRDRGWVIKEMERRDFKKTIGGDVEVLKKVNFWDIGTCNDYCDGSLLLDSVNIYKDGVLTKEFYDRVFNGPDTSVYYNNLLSTITTNLWGISSTTYFDDEYFGTITAPTTFYGNSFIDSVTQKKGATLLSYEFNKFYRDTSTRGYPGQVREKITKVVESGSVTQELTEKYEYIRDGWPTQEIRELDNGSLYRHISPRSDTTEFAYYEEVPVPEWYSVPGGADPYIVNPVYYHELRQSGLTYSSDSSQFDKNGPFWYKKNQFKGSAPRIIHDTLHAYPVVDTVQSGVQSSFGCESEIKVDTIAQKQWVRYWMTLPSGSHCDEKCDGTTYVRIKNGSQVIKQLTCSSNPTVDSGSFWVNPGAIVRAEVNNRDSAGGNHEVRFWYEKTTYQDVVTVDTVPDYITTYRDVDKNGLTKRVVEPNHYLSTLDYDRIDRFKRAVLPGNFVPFDAFDPVADSIVATPSLDAEYRSSALSNCAITTMRLDAPTSRPILSFHDLDLSMLSAEQSIMGVGTNIDSAILTIYCYYNQDGGSLKAYGLGGGAMPACGNAATLSTNVPSSTLTMVGTGLKRINVTDQVIRWVIDSNFTVPSAITPPYALWLNEVVDGVFDFYSTEYTDASKKPQLRIYYQVDYSDSVYTLLSLYDDKPSSVDGDSVAIQFIKRVAEDAYKPTTEIRFDGFTRTVAKLSVDSLADTNTFRLKADFWDRPVQATDELNNTDTSKFDNLDRVTETVFSDADDSKICMEYSSALAPDAGLTAHFTFPTACSTLFLTKTIDEDNRETRSYIDVLGRERLRRQYLSATDSVSTYFDYDDLGNLKRVIKPKGDTVNYEYNSVGWLLREWANDYDSILYKYDKNGNLVLRRDGNLRAMGGGSVKFWEYFRYDGLNRKTESGWLEVTGSDTTGRTRIERYFYDQDSSAHSNGRLSLTFRQYSAFTYGERYDYDERGRLAKQTNCFEATLDSNLYNGIYQYWLSGVPYIIEYTYNWSDQITSITYPNGEVVTYEYDTRGRLKNVGNLVDPNRFASLTYTDRDELQQMKYYSDTSTVSQTIDYAYNERGWLESINSGTATGGDKFGQKLYYTGDLITGSPSFHNGNIVGQILSFDDLALQYRYHYDSLDRVTKVRRRSGASSFQDKQLFTYDKNGNRATYKTSENQLYPLNYNYQSGTNLLVSTSGTGHPTGNYSSDVNGNMKTDSTKKATFYYDLQNHLYQVEIRNAIAGLSSNVVSYHYGCNNERVYKSFKIYWKEFCGGGGGEEMLMGPGGEGLDSLEFESLVLVDSGLGGSEESLGEGGGDWCYYNMTSETRYIVSMGKLLAEYTPSSGTPRYQYIYANDHRIGMRNGTGKLHYYLNDHLGSARVVVDSAANVKDRFRYMAFGAADSGNSTSTGQPQRYTGKTWDDDGGVNLYYYGARYYEPTLGRFTQTDALREAYPSWSPFHYCGNNPIRNVDPDGKDYGFYVDEQGAGGQGHTTLYIQDGAGNWYQFNQYAGGGTSSGQNELSYLLGLDATAEVVLLSVEGPPDGTLIYECTSEQDKLLYASALKSEQGHNSGEESYNLYSNNCTDAACDVINNAGAGISVANPWSIVRPNAWGAMMRLNYEAAKAEARRKKEEAKKKQEESKKKDDDKKKDDQSGSK